MVVLRAIFNWIFLFVFAVLMWKMEEPAEVRWREGAPHPPAWYYKHNHQEENLSCTDRIQILTCHPSQCPEIRPLLQKGELLPFDFLIPFIA